MNLLRIIMIFCVLLVLSINRVVAFELNPMQNKYGQDEIDEDEILQRVSDPVHEEITNIAQVCAGNVNNGNFVACDMNKKYISDKGNKYEPLIRGVWWNDDPNQLLFAARQAKWLSWMNDGKKIVKTGKNWLGQKANVNRNYYMQYRSHFGDLQFLHAMATNNGEDVDKTKGNIIAWSEFAYAVAIGEIRPEVTLDKVKATNFQDYFDHRPGWSVNYLFAPHYTLGKKSIADVALGSILHMIQDSFSKSHTNRMYGETEMCPNGRVTAFYSYVKQSEEKHGAEDKRQSWMSNTDYTPTQNPVYASAKLLAFVDSKADWETVVLPYLRDDLFCTDGDAVASSSGGY